MVYLTNGGRIVVFGGGIPLRRAGTLLGAIGVSGGLVQQDIEVAPVGAIAFKMSFKQSVL